MKVNMITVFSVALAVVLSSPALVQAQQHQHAAPPKTMMSKPEMMKSCQAMMDHSQKMMADMDAMDAELDKSVVAMNTATGAAKVDAAAAVINQLVTQRRAMRGKTAEMQSGMMGHMMGHMRGGNAQAMQKSMAMCPMMKEMEMKK